MLHYILNDDGYLKAVFFGCFSDDCNVWEGEIPDDLEKNLGAYHFGNGEDLSRTVDFKQGYYLDEKGREIINNDGAYLVTDYIPIDANKGYEYYYPTITREYGAYYDEDYNYISNFVMNESTPTNPTTLDIPVTAKYVKFTGHLLSDRFWASLLKVGQDLSGELLMCPNPELVKDTGVYYVAITNNSYSIMAGVMGGVKRIWINKETTGETVAILYQEGINNNFPYYLPEDFGTITTIYTNNLDYNLLTIERESSSNLFNFYSTEELVLDEAKLEELQNNIPYDYSFNEVFTGKYWADGNPIYSRTFDLGRLDGSGQKKEFTFNGNYLNVIKKETGIYADNYGLTPLPIINTVDNINLTDEINADTEGTLKITLMRNNQSFFEGWYYVATVYYTKIED